MRTAPDAKRLYLIVGWLGIAIFFCALAVALARNVEVPYWAVFSAFVPYLMAEVHHRNRAPAGEDVRSVLLAVAALLGSLAVGWHALGD